METLTKIKYHLNKLRIKDKIMLKQITLICFLFFSFVETQAQNLPRLSSLSEIKEKVGYTDIKIEYSRPSVKGRKIFGDLVSYDLIWRVGANGDTKITFSTDITINDTILKAGSYSIFIKPKRTSWVIYFYQKSATDWDGVPPQNSTEHYAWSSEKLKLKYESNVKKVEHVETLTIGIQDITPNKATLFMTWDSVKVVVPFTTKSTEWAVGSIERRLQEPTAWKYYDYANFYMGNSIKLEKALEYINIAINQSDESSWWFLRLKSQILAKLKRYDEAIVTAKEGLEAGKKTGEKFYITQSNNDIKRWLNKNEN